MSIHPEPPEIPVAGYPALAPSPLAATDHQPKHPLRRLIIIAAAVLSFAAFVAFYVWFISEPCLPKFSVSSASLHGLSTTASFNVTFSVRNPSQRFGIRYAEAEASVTYGGWDSVVAKSALPPLYLGSDSSTVIRAWLVAAIADDWAVKGTVEFGFWIRAVAYLRSSALRPRRHHMMVYCCDVPFRFTNSTAAVLSDPQRPCKTVM
ncbi:hypothetical protein QJS10_CPA08g01373 [Acorus calamus]|uniref:Late embryogenesis abundant protein LEA-2 subgroup domain-containing protein n=1 Tax=Acorus calamus TaxID=4465 RepID=A0AAV9EA88_ACOCL|nr:hypothetical protein QJS10_CPA08g01373 [Acorus calamus]